MSSVIISGDTSGAVTLAAPAVAGTNTLTLQAATATNAVNKLETAVASTSGVSIDYTSLPSWIKRITVMFAGVSTNGTSPIQIQLGDSGGIETTGYLTATWTANTNNTNYTSGFVLRIGSTTAMTQSGHLVLTLAGSNLWVGSGISARTDAADSSIFGGNKTLSDTLTQVRITTVNGTDLFDAGTINLLLEG